MSCLLPSHIDWTIAHRTGWLKCCRILNHTSSHTSKPYMAEGHCNEYNKIFQKRRHFTMHWISRGFSWWRRNMKEQKGITQKRHSYSERITIACGNDSPTKKLWDDDVGMNILIDQRVRTYRFSTYAPAEGGGELVRPPPPSPFGP